MKIQKFALVALVLSSVAGCAPAVPTALPGAPTTVPAAATALPATPTRIAPTAPLLLNRYVETAGGFSFVPPDGWQMQEILGLKYKIARGAASDGFAPNIVVLDEASGGSLDDYVKAQIATLPRIFQDFRLIAQNDFQPNEGSRAVKLVTEITRDGRKARQTYYIFDSPNKKFVVACTRLADKQEAVDAACDQSMKTFRIESAATSAKPPSPAGAADPVATVNKFFDAISKGDVDIFSALIVDNMTYNQDPNMHEVGKEDVQAKLLANYILGWKYTLSNLRATGPSVEFNAQASSGPYYKCSADVASGKIAALTCRFSNASGTVIPYQASPTPATNDPVFVIKSFFDAINAGNIDAAVAFADGILNFGSTTAMGPDDLRVKLAAMKARGIKYTLSNVQADSNPFPSNATFPRSVRFTAQTSDGKTYKDCSAFVVDGKIISLTMQ